MAKPSVLRLDDEEYRATLFLIHTKDFLGRPAIMKVMPDGKKEISLVGGEDFLIAYVPAKMLVKH